MRIVCIAVGALLLGVGAASAVAAQLPGGLSPGDTLREVRLTDGSVMVARIVSVGADGVIALETSAGLRIEARPAQIQSIRTAPGRIVGGRFWRDDPNRTRLFFAPTGRSLPAGEGYFAVYELFIPFVSVGVTDRLTLSGGSPFYLGMFEETPPIYVAPKLQVVALPQAQLAVGVLALFLPGAWDWDSEDSQTAGIAYGVGTFGDHDNAVTAGLGWGWANREFSARPVVMLGGEARAGRATKLITENWFVPGQEGIVWSGGVRFFGERLSADAGLIGYAGGGGSACCLPLVNFVYAFGGRP